MNLPKISILVVTYLESNQRYLDLCLKSIINLNYPKELLDVLVLSTGDYEPHTMGFRTIHTDRHYHYPEACNFGVKHLDKDSTHFLILNDDVILTKNSLRSLVAAAGDVDVIVGPVSNCDNGWKYSIPYIGYMDGGEFKQLTKRFYRYEELAHDADKIMDYNLPVNPGVWRQDYICFYAVLIPRKVWDKLGPLDNNLKTGFDDTDYCHRASLEKIPVIISQDAFVLHFGGVSADIVLTPEIRDYNAEYFKNKWPNYKW